MRATLLAVAALAFLRIVVGMHFFLEGLSHLRDPNWSSAGFRQAAVGPWAEWYRAGLPQTGNWLETLGAPGTKSAADGAAAWKESVVAGWRTLLAERSRLVPLDAAAKAAAEERLAAASGELDDYIAGIADDLTAWRLERERLESTERSPGARQIPFARDRVTKKRRELSAQASGWMGDAAAIGRKLVGEWDRALSPADRMRAAPAQQPSALWKADRFVSWSLVTIGACLVLGLLVKFNAMGGAFFLASVIASQPFWVAGAQPTYDQWVELAALLAIASLPTGGWSGLDFFLPVHCPMSRWLSGDSKR